MNTGMKKTILAIALIAGSITPAAGSETAETFVAKHTVDARVYWDTLTGCRVGVEYMGSSKAFRKNKDCLKYKKMHKKVITPLYATLQEMEKQNPSAFNTKEGRHMLWMLEEANNELRAISRLIELERI